MSTVADDRSRANQDQAGTVLRPRRPDDHLRRRDDNRDVDGAQPVEHGRTTAAAATAAPDPGDPAMVGVPTFVFGSIALGLALTGYLPAAAAAGVLPIIIACTGVGQVVATVWAARLGQSAVASIFGIFSGFWLSYAVLLLGLGHDWFGVTKADTQRTVSTFLLTWAIAVALLTLVTARLPLAVTVLFVLVDIALILVFLGNEQTSTSLNHAGGYTVFGFATLGAYLFAGAASAATGGKAYPLGRPLVH